MHSLADCIELRGWLPDCPVQRSLDAISLRSIVRSLVDNFLPARCMQHIASYLCVKHTGAACSDSNECMSLHPGYHNHQPCMREHCSRLTRRLAANLDLAAEARLKPPKPKNAADIPHSESEADIEATAETEEQLFFGPDYEDELGPIEDENLPLSAAYAFLMPQGQDAADFALRKDIVLDATRAKRPTVSQKMLSKYYAVFSHCFSKQHLWIKMLFAPMESTLKTILRRQWPRRRRGSMLQKSKKKLLSLTPTKALMKNITKNTIKKNVTQN